MNVLNLSIMARKRKGGNTPRVNRTNFSTSDYRGARRAATDSETGKVGRSGQFITRRQRTYDMRVAFGLAGG